MTDDPADPDDPPPPGPAPPPAPRDGDDEEHDAIFETLWSRVLDAWHDDKVHGAMLEHALRAQMLPELAGRYRTLKDDPEKGARAQKKIDGIVVAATQMLMATKTPPRTKTPLSWTLLAALLFAVAITVIVYKLFLGR